MRVGEAVSRLAKALESVSDAPLFEAKQLMAHCLGKRSVGPAEAEELFPGKYPQDAEDWLKNALERRLNGEPLQYILGEWSFMGLDIAVRPCALIPRQDTETLAERALEIIKERRASSALDICTGTGCIALALKKLGGVDKVTAADISPECCELAMENASRVGVDLEVICTDLFEGLGRYELITANPPYIPTGELAELQREVRREPMLALDGGGDGLGFYRRIAREWTEHIMPGGTLLMEVGAGQARDVAGLFCGYPTRIIKDLCGIDRVVEADYEP